MQKKEVELLTINEWCTRYGIKVLNPIGFKNTKRSHIYTNKYTRGQFRRGLRKSYITVNTEKGLVFLNYNR